MTSLPDLQRKASSRRLPAAPITYENGRHTTGWSVPRSPEFQKKMMAHSAARPFSRSPERIFPTGSWSAAVTAIVRSLTGCCSLIWTTGVPPHAFFVPDVSGSMKRALDS
jgi:hypothetical protein